VRRLDSRVLRGPDVCDYTSAAEALSGHGTEWFKYSELELITN